ncbi:hypothetical protein ACFVT2_19685 [Streptomyces sp. NPDC058000]|uniref:hypothetical protein n=1 Tax=Streptomyces sp. NPDC058000 TaxID=3346299 RepID=UPI0036EB489D
MILPISALVLSAVLTIVMLRTRYLRLGGAFTAACLGYFLAASGAAPAINTFFTSITAGIASLTHSFG